MRGEKEWKSSKRQKIVQNEQKSGEIFIFPYFSALEDEGRGRGGNCENQESTNRQHAEAARVPLKGRKE